LKTLIGYERVLTSYAFGEYAHVSFKEPRAPGPQADQADQADMDEAVRYLQARGLTDIEIKPAEVTIEDSFIKLLKD
jgi:hypothetical protein